MAHVAKIIPFQQPSAHFSYEKRGGYTQIAPEIIGSFFEYMRGIGPDAFIIKSYTMKDGAPHGTEIMRGCVPTEAYDRSLIRQAQIALEAELDSRAPEAFNCIDDRVSRNFQNRDHGNDVVFVKTDQGIIGCGWFDSAHTRKKGLKMAAFMLYALGSINPHDKKLLTAVYNYLPYDSELNTVEAEKASNIIVRVLGEKLNQ